MVEDSEVVAALQELLRTADLNTTTTASVCRQLEKDLGIDLSTRKKFIREQIRLFLTSHDDEPQNDVVEEVQEEVIENVKGEDDSSNGSAQEEDNRKEILEKKKKVVKKRSGGFTKPCALSPELEEIVGEAELARTEVVKRIWVYIRENNLQNPNDRRKILCDEKLYSLFQVKSIDMFKMSQALTKHIWPIEDLVVPVKPSRNVKGEDDSSNGSAQEEDNRLEKKEKVVKKRSGGFTKPCALSPELEEIVGEAELARTEVVKRIWVYIRENDLQNPNDRRKILCDEKLYSLFQVKSIDMFKMSQALTKHIWPIEDLVVPVEPSRKDKQRKRKKEIVPVDPSRKDKQPKRKKESEGDQKKQKGTGSGFLMSLPLSDALVKFIGTGENALPRSDVVKRIWQYIKENNLQDPSNKKKVLCDSKLKELFGVDTYIGFTLTKLLTPHFIKEV